MSTPPNPVTLQTAIRYCIMMETPEEGVPSLSRAELRLLGDCPRGRNRMLRHKCSRNVSAPQRSHLSDCRRTHCSRREKPVKGNWQLMPASCMIERLLLHCKRVTWAGVGQNGRYHIICKTEYMPKLHALPCNSPVIACGTVEEVPDCQISHPTHRSTSWVRPSDVWSMVGFGKRFHISSSVFTSLSVSTLSRGAYIELPHFLSPSIFNIFSLWKILSHLSLTLR
jgi:hypothetical protein